MNNTSFKFTEDGKAGFAARFSDFEQLYQKAKKATAEDTGTFDVIISTDDLDRAGEIVKQDGWDFTNYKNNPIVLWGHDYYSLPIGICTNITVEGNKTRAQGIFLPAEVNPLAQQVRRLYDFGMKNGKGVGCTTSVGFIPKEFDMKDSSIITRAELLEFSFVPIPANQGVGAAQGRSLTLEEAKAINLDVTAFKIKGMEFSVKAATAGDACQTDDGSPGLLATDPNDPDGPMVCVVEDDDKTKAKENDIEDGGSDKQDSMKTEKELKKGIDAEHDRHDEAVEKSFADFQEKCEKGMKEGEKAHKEFDMKATLKELRGSLEDEHDMHRKNNVEMFKKSEPEKEKKEKSAEMKKSIKSLHTEHDAYEGKCMKDLGKFEEKCMKSVEGDKENHDEHTDWVTDKMEGHQETHRENVHELGKAMMDSFGEGEDTEEKKFIESVVAFLKENTEKSIAEAIEKCSTDVDTEKLGEACKNLIAAKAVLDGIEKAIADGSGENKPADGAAPTSQRSRSASHTTAEEEELNAHLFARQIVRSIESAARDGLAKINDQVKSHYSRRGSK